MLCSTVVATVQATSKNNLGDGWHEVIRSSLCTRMTLWGKGEAVWNQHTLDDGEPDE